MTWTNTYANRGLERDGFFLEKFTNSYICYRYNRLKYKDVNYQLYFSKNSKGVWSKYYKISSNNSKHYLIEKPVALRMFNNKSVVKAVELLNRYF